MCYNLFINGVYWGYNLLILTIDPNFLGHPSTPWNFNIPEKLPSKTEFVIFGDRTVKLREGKPLQIIYETTEWLFLVRVAFKAWETLA